MKTIRLYDKHNDIITEIMTEQIVGEFHSNLFYEASTLVYNNCIYYFKRHIVDQRLAPTTCMTSKEKENLNKKDEPVDIDNPQFYHIYMQLYKYDFLVFEETMVKGYVI